MAPFFAHHDGEDRLAEAARLSPLPPKSGSGQRVRVGTIERDNGLVTASSSSVSNALYDLADQNSLTHTVLLPHGTTVKLAATSPPAIGSWRSRFTIENPSLTKSVDAVGASKAADLASQIDMLALGKKDKGAMEKMTEADAQIHVSGYVTKSGRHVGAYSQIRQKLSSLKSGQTVHFPDGIAAHRAGSRGYAVGSSAKGSNPIGMSATHVVDDLDEATAMIAKRSASSQQPNSLGSGWSHKISGDEASVDALPENERPAAAFKPGDFVSVKSPGSQVDGARSAKVVGPSKTSSDHTVVEAGGFSQAVPTKHLTKSDGRDEGLTAFREGNGTPGSGKQIPLPEAKGSPLITRGGLPLPPRSKNSGRAKGGAKAGAVDDPLNRGGESTATPDARSLSVSQLIANYRAMHGRDPSATELAKLERSRKRKKKVSEGERSSFFAGADND